MLKLLLLLLTALACSTAHASEAKVRELLQKNFPQSAGKIEKVSKTGFLGLYEIVTRDQLFYTDEKAQYLINGNIYELKSMRNLTEERARQLFAVDFNALPLEIAIKKVKGGGQRKMAYFTDPNCGYCKKLEQELKNIDNVTLYVFLYPLFLGSDEKVRGVWCSKDPVKAWDDLMLNNVQAQDGSCDAPTARVLELGKKLNVNGTPALIFADGVVVPGYMPAPELEKALGGATGR
jgi:thiol:disulfide interchange protein DsbC